MVTRQYHPFVVSAIVQEQAAQVSEDLAALAEPHRLLMLRQLRRGPRTAGYLARALDITPSLASHHLALLERADLVQRRRIGTYICYAANTAKVRALHERLGRMAGATGAAGEHAAALASEPC